MNHSTGRHLQAFLKDPKGVSALLPTSAPVLQRIVAKIRPEAADMIIEYGPGSGVLTRLLLERLAPGGHLLAIERNPDLAAGLSASLDDPRITVVRESAASVLALLERLELPPADYVFSGIPFSFIEPADAARIVANTHRALTDGGRFVTYQTFYQRRRRLRAHLERSFSTVHSELGLRNLPPYRICEAVK